MLQIGNHEQKYMSLSTDQHDIFLVAQYLIHFSLPRLPQG